MAENTRLFNLRTKVAQMQSRNAEAFEESNYSESYHEYLADIRSEPRKLKRLQIIEELNTKQEEEEIKGEDISEEVNTFLHLKHYKKQEFHKKLSDVIDRTDLPKLKGIYSIWERYLEPLPKIIYKNDKYQKWKSNRKNTLMFGTINFNNTELDEGVDNFSVWKSVKCQIK